MASETRASTEVFRDAYGVILDESNGVLELRWLDDSATMTDGDFKRWLERLASASEARPCSHLLIDITHFAHRPGEDVAAWRDEHIIPRYNQAGVRKFAFLLPKGAPGTVAAGNQPAPEPPGNFPIGYFDDRDAIDAWFVD